MSLYQINKKTDVALESKLDKLALELYKKHDFVVVPRYPWVVVRVLPREQVVGGIILSENKQNKPVLEGIVLRTWEPWTKKVNDSSFPELGGTKEIAIPMKSNFVIGDHIIFQHWTGLPLPGVHENIYRMVPERDSYSGESGPIYAKLEYQRESSSEKLTGLIQSLIHYIKEDKLSEERLVTLFEDKMHEHFDIVRKITGSRTISGR